MQKKFDAWGIKGHDGVDFGLPEGTEVVAVDAGTVSQYGENGDFGISVTIKHEWGISLYAHLHDTAITLHQNIKEGEVIGHSGQTGVTTGPHLHFGIKPNDEVLENGYLGFVDPTPGFVKARQFKVIKRQQTLEREGKIRQKGIRGRSVYTPVQ
ncbi:M23 family metallopeptidase [Candidatus Gottesmanbacteria bacterium]|nr:M23 family metallopeptidase [Candidatus Gottesmanbacteria bacterium]